MLLSVLDMQCLCVCSYQINARTELAIRYNDKSPLENHHCAVAFQILEKVRNCQGLYDTE